MNRITTKVEMNVETMRKIQQAQFILRSNPQCANYITIGEALDWLIAGCPVDDWVTEMRAKNESLGVLHVD